MTFCVALNLRGNQGAAMTASAEGRRRLIATWALIAQRIISRRFHTMFQAGNNPKYIHTVHKYMLSLAYSCGQVSTPQCKAGSFESRPFDFLATCSVLTTLTMIADNQLDSLATGLGVTMMVLIIVRTCFDVPLRIQLYHFLSVNAGSALKTSATAGSGVRQRTVSTYLIG
jgi:Oligosaccaryltransferase